MNIDNYQQAFYQKKNYLTHLKEYEQILTINTLTNALTEENPKKLLIVAKSYYLTKDYQACIDILNKIPLFAHTHILFQMTCLKIKASYILKPNEKQILSSYMQELFDNKNKCRGDPLTNHHMADLQQLAQMVGISNKIRKGHQIQLRIKTARKQKHSNASRFIEIQQSSQSSQPISDEKSLLGNLGKRQSNQGFPCFIVERVWIQKWQRHLRGLGTWPGPITNFTLLNHIGNLLYFQQQINTYMNKIMFPMYEQDYVCLTKRQWTILFKIYGGIPIKRLFSRTNSKKGIEVIGGDNLKKFVIRVKRQQYVVQLPNNIFLEDANKIMEKYFQQGQLKIVPKEDEYLFSEVPPNIVVANLSAQPLKYMNVTLERNHDLIQVEVYKKDFLLNNFDLQRYQLKKQRPLLGLKNLGNTCYLNASLQCLNSCRDYAEYFIYNNYAQDLNFTLSNRNGSYGQIVCAFAELIKAINLGNQNQSYNPTKFKLFFGKRFSDFSSFTQQDANQFINFLLGCTHDDLNTQQDLKPGSSILRASTFLQVKALFMGNLKKSSHSIVTRLMQGINYSVIGCEKCNSQLYRFEVFLTLQLEIPPANDSISMFLVRQNPKIKLAAKIVVHILKMNVAGDVIRTVKEKLESEKNFVMFLLNENDFKIFMQVPETMRIDQLQKYSTQYFLFIYELPQIGFAKMSIITYSQHYYFWGGKHIGYPRFKAISQGTAYQLIQDIVYDSLYFRESNCTDFGMAMKKDIINAQLKPTKDQSKLSKSVQKSMKDESKLSRSVESKLSKSVQKPIQQKKIKLPSRQELFNRIKIYAIDGPIISKEIHVVFNKIPEQLTMNFYAPSQMQFGRMINRKKIKIDIYACLKMYKQKEKLEKDSWKCKNCDKETIGFKQDLLYSTGQILIISLKRFKERQKITVKVDYPVQGLNLEEYLEGSHSHPQQCIYDLVSVILHQGTLFHGHYTSYCFNEERKKWYLYDDQRVIQLIDKTLLVSQHAYMLFYKRREQKEKKIGEEQQHLIN